MCLRSFVIVEPITLKNIHNYLSKKHKNKKKMAHWLKAHSMDSLKEACGDVLYFPSTL